MQALYTLRDGTIVWECPIAAFVYVILVERGNIVSSSDKLFDVFFKACLQTQSFFSNSSAVHFHSIQYHLLVLLRKFLFICTNNLRVGYKTLTCTYFTFNRDFNRITMSVVFFVCPRPFHDLLIKS